jgi:hypothetical protein
MDTRQFALIVCCVGGPQWPAEWLTNRSLSTTLFCFDRSDDRCRCTRRDGSTSPNVARESSCPSFFFIKKIESRFCIGWQLVCSDSRRSLFSKLQVSKRSTDSGSEYIMAENKVLHSSEYAHILYSNILTQIERTFSAYMKFISTYKAPARLSVIVAHDAN